MLDRLKADEGGFTLVEMIISIAILSVILGAVTLLFTSGMHSQTDLNARYQAQIGLNTAFLELRREAHSACGLAAGYTTSSITLNEPGAGTFQPPSTPCSVPTAVTWCVIGSSSRYKLYRVAGTACTATGAHLYSDYITQSAVFPTYTAESSANATLGYLSVDFPISIQPSAVHQDKYELKDTIVFRNSSL